MSEEGLVIKPSNVVRRLFDTVWQNSEKETIATNILKLARFGKGDSWEPFTWEDYIDFCSHKASFAEQRILDWFVVTGYLSKDANGAYHFERKILGVYMQYC